MHRVSRSQNLPALLPADYFDVICGTSTGGVSIMFNERNNSFQRYIGLLLYFSVASACPFPKPSTSTDSWLKKSSRTRNLVGRMGASKLQI